MPNLKTLFVVLLSQKSLFASAMYCEMHAYPTPAYHALGEQDLQALDTTVTQTLMHHAIGDIFDHTVVIEVENTTVIETLDQMIAPLDEEDRRRALLDDSKTTQEHRDMQMGWRWWGKFSSSFPCRVCNSDNSDGRRGLTDDNNLEGIADALVVSLLESNIDYFSAITCVTYTCEAFDDISVGCLA